MKFPSKSFLQPYLWLPLMLTLIRLLLVGVFLVSNYLPHTRTMMVVIHWDWTLAITITVFGLLGGFISHHIRSSILKTAQSEADRSTLGMKVVLISLLGSISGLSISLLLPLVVSLKI